MHEPQSDSADCVRDYYAIGNANRNSGMIYGLERNKHTLTTGTMATAMCVGAGSGLSIITVFFSCEKIGSVEFGGTVSAGKDGGRSHLWWISHSLVKLAYLSIDA